MCIRDSTYIASGTLNYVTDYTDFSSVTEDQTGNYIALKVTAGAEVTISDAMTIEVTGNQTKSFGKSHLEIDDSFVIVMRANAIKAKENGQVITFAIDWDGPDASAYAQTTYTVDLTGVTLASAPSAE